MKPLTIVLSSGVIAGLAVYFALTAIDALGMLMGDVMTIRIPIFVATLAVVGFGSAGLALLFQRSFARAEAGAVRALEQRLQELERRGG